MLRKESVTKRKRNGKKKKNKKLVLMNDKSRKR